MFDVCSSFLEAYDLVLFSFFDLSYCDEQEYQISEEDFSLSLSIYLSLHTQKRDEDRTLFHDLVFRRYNITLFLWDSLVFSWLYPDIEISFQSNVMNPQNNPQIFGSEPGVIF